MGINIDRDQFSDEDVARFTARLRASLHALRTTLARPDFGVGPASIGWELELNLIDPHGRPALCNREVMRTCGDPSVTLEIDRFNLEINGDPRPLRGTPFSAMEEEMRNRLTRLDQAARVHQAQILAIGILPTLTDDILRGPVMTDGARYRALSARLRSHRQKPFRMRIEGVDALELEADNAALEGANTSFQLHLRVSPPDYAAMFNAALMATGPVLAWACNSPLLFGRRLWQETRIALFRQSVDDRPEATEDDWRPARVSFGHGWCRRGVYELFAENAVLHEPLLPVMSDEDPAAMVARGMVPNLEELRLQSGTVWRWNRPVYDSADGGHLRIEMRALPAGPTARDMVANAALLLGLCHRLAPDIESWLSGMTFGHARQNFYQAARHGHEAQLYFPKSAGEPSTAWSAGDLMRRLLPEAHAGLEQAGVTAQEASRWLQPIHSRLATNQTGASWQSRTWSSLRERVSADEVANRLVETYLSNLQKGIDVSEWD